MQETGQIPDCSFYLLVSMFWNDPVVGTRYTTDVVAGYPGTTWQFLVNCTVVFFFFDNGIWSYLQFVPNLRTISGKPSSKSAGCAEGSTKY